MEQPQLVGQTFGELVESCYLEAMRAWRMDYARGEKVADLLGGDLTRVDVQLTHYPRGKVDVVVTITARVRSRSEVYFYPARREGVQTYRRIEPSQAKH